MKKCSRCKQEKEINDFYHRESRCKICVSIIRKEKWENDKHLRQKKERKPRVKKEKKICTICKLEKPIVEFYNGSGRCKKCTKEIKDSKRDIIRERDKQYRIKNREILKNKAKEYNAKNRDEIRKRELKSKKELVIRFGDKCSKCGKENLPIVLYHFHHVGEKKNQISNLYSKQNKEKLEEELKNCVMLCISCHRIEHGGTETAWESRSVKAIAVISKGNKCNECGKENLPLCCFDFHHRNQEEKDFKLSNKFGCKNIKEELDKCDMLCCECHKLKHNVNHKVQDII